MISNVGKKIETTPVKSASEDLKSFTNTEDIKDFYEYTGECLKRISSLKQPSLDEINALALELPISEEEFKSNYFSKISKKACNF